MHLLRLINSVLSPSLWKKMDYNLIAEEAKSLSDKMTGAHIEKIFLVNVLTAHTLEQSQSNNDFFKNSKAASVDQQEVLRNAAKILLKDKPNETLKTDLLNYFYGFWDSATNRNKKLTDEVKKILSKLIILSEMIISGKMENTRSGIVKLSPKFLES
ncbi:hypothetical protein TUBRATIS_11810 [Tubulinosema ratisbonensis]|uniref:Uncharacterized protein n=1 Tax=Tubulinosema ratisbonensis TaxID=291195 RepID=A0A437AMF0_9MICR|nr:hypothetical protein TUBRATIS_11810 [Tubulinosema ratisbonensis]